MAWTPDLTVVPGAWGGEMVAAHSRVSAGLRLGNRLQGYHSRLEGLGAEAARGQAELPEGPGRGVAATGSQQDHQMKEQWWAEPRLPASAGLLREGGRGGGVPHRLLSTSRSLKSLLGPQLCLRLPPARPGPAPCRHMSGDRPALSCGPAAPAPSDG